LSLHFELIYFARPDSQIFGQNVYLYRKRLGHELAREYCPDVDIIMPFPTPAFTPLWVTRKKVALLLRWV